MTDTQIAVAILAPILAALVGLAVKHWYFDAERKLRVTAMLWKVKQSKFLKTLFDEQIQRGLRETNDRWKPSFVLGRAASYIEIEIKNTSKKRIDGITLVLSETGNDICYQVEEDDNLLSVEQGQKIELGNLQPDHCLNLHVWCGYDVGRRGTELKKILRVSADEIDRVQFRYPLPDYQKYRYVMRMLNIIWIISLIVGLVAMGYGSFKGDQKTHGKATSGMPGASDKSP